MPYVKTGRPPGRPKTKEYETLTARVPQDIADHAREYAARHRQSLSDVLRDGLHGLLEEDRYRPFMSDTNGAPEKVSDSNTLSGDTPENLSDTIPTDPAPENLSDINIPQDNGADTLAGSDTQENVSDRNGAAPEIVSDSNVALPTPAFDPVKYRLGKLCPQGHTWETTGQSLRVKNKAGYCIECNRAIKRDTRRARRAGEVA